MDVEKLVDLEELVVGCPVCGAALSPTSVCVAGMPIIVSARCSGCGRVFDFDWPAGHALLHPVIVDRETRAAHVGGADWYIRHFLRCLASRENPASLEILVRGECRPGRAAVLVNCVDYLYGHVLWKLMSVPRHIREAPDDDVVVIVPRLLAWLVPAGVVAIEVDLPLSRGTEWIEGLDAVVERVLAPCAAVRISPTVSQPDVTLQDLAMLGVDLTPSQSLDHRELPLQVGFVLRNDRLWTGPASPALQFAQRLLPKHLVQALLLRRQHRNYARLARRIRERHPQTRVVAFGIGHPGGLPADVEDLRTPGPIREESTWLEEYGHCRVAVGLHGSALLLPSLLAGAVVDLVPAHKLDAAFGTDVIIPRGTIPHPKLSLFRYRMLPETSSPELVAANVLSVIDHVDFQRRNLIENQHTYEAPGWPQEVHWREVAREPAAAWAGGVGQRSEHLTPADLPAVLLARAKRHSRTLARARRRRTGRLP
jgi:hypothetical protein